MPTYVYECSSCKTTFEAEQRITEDPLDTCLCGSKGTVKRVIQPVGVMFKGAGFHINDYASSSSPAKPETKAETKVESKPSETSSSPEGSSTPNPAPTPSTES